MRHVVLGPAQSYETNQKREVNDMVVFVAIVAIVAIERDLVAKITSIRDGKIATIAEQDS